MSTIAAKGRRKGSKTNKKSAKTPPSTNYLIFVISTTVGVLACIAIILTSLGRAKSNISVSAATTEAQTAAESPKVEVLPEDTTQHAEETETEAQEPYKTDNKTTESKSSSTPSATVDTPAQTIPAPTPSTPVATVVTDCATPGGQAIYLPTNYECRITREADTTTVVNLERLSDKSYKSGMTVTSSNQSVISVPNTTSGSIRFNALRAGKADIVVWRKAGESIFMTVHVTVTAKPIVKPQTISVKCPTRTLFNRPYVPKKLDISYYPANADTSGASISASPAEDLKLSLDGAYKYSIYATNSTDNIPATPVTITVSAGGATGSCTF